MSDIICPHCGSVMIFDPRIGEVLCPSCGYVPYRRRVVTYPEWKAIDPEDKIRKSRAGPPITLTKHDLGLSTDLGFEDLDAHGGRLTDREQVKRMRVWQSRIRARTGKEKSMVALLAKISEFSSMLNLPDNVVETASLIIRKAVKKGITSKRSISGMAAAAVYMACRQCGVQRGLKEISRVSGVRTKSLGAYYRYLYTEVGGIRVAPTPIEKYISKISNKVGLSSRVVRLAVTMAKKMNDPDLVSGRQPSGLAAAFIYIAASMLDEAVLQKDIAAAANVTEVTIRKRCREILENYRITLRLKG